MREEKINIDGVEIYLDKEVRDWQPVEFPYCRLRGKRVTEEQAFEIIRRCDRIFQTEQMELNDPPDYLKPINLDMDWFEFRRFGWVHPNGIVGANMTFRWWEMFQRNHSRQVPVTDTPALSVEQLAEELAAYAKNFPYLDFVIAITDRNEEFPLRKEKHDELWSAHKKGKISYGVWEVKHDELSLTDLERDSFEAAVAAGAWVHDGIVEIMNSERAREKYLEYEKKYEEADGRIYLYKYYNLYQNDIVTRDYLCRCLAAYGISDPDGFIREKLGRSCDLHLKHLPRGVRNGEFMREEIKEVDGVKVIIDSEAKDWDSLPKYPYYRIRGKRLTKEQTAEIINSTIDSYHFDIQSGNGYIFGWVHSNGIVGTNSNMGKYPNTEELVEEWTGYVKEFPFLDLVVAIFWWESYCNERHQANDELFNKLYREKSITEEEFKRQMEELDFTDLERDDSYREFPKENFKRSIEVGVWVHDGIVEIMESDRAYEKYIEYEKLYEEPDPRIYMPGYYQKFCPKQEL